MKLENKEEKLFKNYQNQRWSFQEFDQGAIDQVMKTYDISQTLARVLVHNMQSI